MLDLGCGDGSLLKHLAEVRQVRGYGVENDPYKLLACTRNGVNVIQMDMEKGLAGIEDGEGVATKRGELVAEFGAARVRNTPLAEGIIAGTAAGA
ncbi:hypothetical protein LLG90_27635, partial [Aromatoleum toluclasticum]|uniref:methionine biosynthesis protein MetW n=1 Tax=Aromatoleum toluclasticum TaxID=92003 RepID=UPI002B1CB5CE